MFLRFEVVIIEEAVSPSGLIATSNCISKAPVAYSGSLIYGKGSGFGEVCSGPEMMDVEGMRTKDDGCRRNENKSNTEKN